MKKATQGVLSRVCAVVKKWPAHCHCSGTDRSGCTPRLFRDVHAKATQHSVFAAGSLGDESPPRPGSEPRVLLCAWRVITTLGITRLLVGNVEPSHVTGGRCAPIRCGEHCGAPVVESYRRLIVVLVCPHYYSCCNIPSYKASSNRPLSMHTKYMHRT